MTASSSSFPLLLANPHPGLEFLKRKIKIHHQRTATALPLSITSSSTDITTSSSKSTKLITFLGKGGSGKTTAAIFAAQHYAAAGLSTCLIIQTQDPSADYLLNCKIGSTPICCKDNLSAVRLETTKMLLEPLKQLKQADARLKMTQGVLEGVVGEELGVLPAMDSIFGALAVERLVRFATNVNNAKAKQDKYDVVIFDGLSSDEILRLMGAASKARLYLKYLRNLTEKTEIGRLAGPSFLRLVDEAMNFSGGSSQWSGKMSAELWDILERFLEQGSSAYSDPRKFSSFLVMDSKSLTSVNSALRYWGCAIQAGGQVSGAIGIPSAHLSSKSTEQIKNDFSPLPFAFLPNIPMDHPVDWESIVSNSVNHDARALFSLSECPSAHLTSPVKFDEAKKSITLFMPGFDKTEIKLYQYRGGSELLVEAGDQRRVIILPPKIQGKVGGAKFIERSLVISMQV